VRNLTIDVAGHTEPNLKVWLRSRCGKIKDGVAFAHGKEGGWVIGFADLERIYLAAKAQRTADMTGAAQ
jgi:hypothetical protein